MADKNEKSADDIFKKLELPDPPKDIMKALRDQERKDHEETYKKLQQAEKKVLQLEEKLAQRSKSLEERIEELELAVKQIRNTLRSHASVVDMHRPMR